MSTSSRKVSQVEQDRRRAAAEAKLQLAHQRIVDGVEALITGEDWAAYLRFAARFHSYSFNNTLSIMLQAPRATWVAGYHTWLELGRQVRKGEAGITILAPVLAKRNGQAETEGPGASPNILDHRDPASAEHTGSSSIGGRRIVGVRTATIFDVTQTDPVIPDTELPLVTPVLLHGDAAPGLWEALATIAQDRGYTLERGDCRGANGVTYFTERLIRVRDDVSPLQAVKTLAHELGHVLLHHPDDRSEDTPDCRGLIEVEAESVACITLNSQGLDSAEYTFPYVATWAAGSNAADPEAVTAAIRDTGNRVIAAARTIITALDLQAAESPAADLAAVHERPVAAVEHLDSAPGLRNTPPPLPPTVAVPHHHPYSLADLAAVNTATMGYFTDYNRCSVAADYLRNRGVQAPARYQVGYAPAGGGLVDHLRGLGFADEHQLAAGVVRRNADGHVRDAFRHRVVVAVIDQAGRIAGFVGRSLGADQWGPRYLNTTATPLFTKGQLLYGLEEGRVPLRAGATPVLVEGFVDVLAIAQHTDQFVPVAALGTAFTADHADQLAAAAPARRLIEALDSDQAGRAAAAKVAELLIPAGWQLRTPLMIPDTDPAMLAHLHGDRIVDWLDPRRCRPTLYEVVDHRIKAHGELTWPEQRVAAYHDAATYLTEHFPDTGERSQAISRAGVLTGMPPVDSAAPSRTAAAPERVATPSRSRQAPALG
jgi:DNA primase